MFENDSTVIRKTVTDETDTLTKLDSGMVLIKQDLLEVSQKISCYYAPVFRLNSKSLILLPIDPQHLFIYWSMNDNSAKISSKANSDKELILRIYCQHTEKKECAKALFEMTIHHSQSRQKIKLPLLQKMTVYKASIGIYDLENVFIPLINSNVTQVFQSNSEKVFAENNADQKNSFSLENFNYCTKNETQSAFLIENSLLEERFETKPKHLAANFSGIGKTKNRCNE